MKTKRRTYEVLVNCPELRKRKTYSIRSSSKDSAWNKGFRKFANEFPRVLTRGLAVGGDSKVSS
jgi:hypothetical protein